MHMNKPAFPSIYHPILESNWKLRRGYIQFYIPVFGLPSYYDTVTPAGVECWHYPYFDPVDATWRVYPPTPAFAKAGAAPGTTGGVELRSLVASKAHAFPRQQLCQLHAPAISMPLHAPAISMPLPSVFQGVQDCLWSQAKAHAFPTQQLCQLHAPDIYMPLPSVFHGVQDCRLPGFKSSKPFKPFRRPFQGNNSYSYMPLPSVFQGVQDCRLPGFKPSKPFKPFRRPFQGNNSYSYMPLPSVFQGVQDCRLPGLKPSKPFKPFRRPFQGNNSYSYMPLPSVFQGVQDCRLPGFKPSKPFKPFRRPFHCNNSYSYMPFPRQQLSQLHPFARLQTHQTPQQASKATTLTATCPYHLFFRGFKTAVCPASNPPNPSNPSAGLSKATTLTATTCPCHLFFRWFKTAVCPAPNPPSPSASLSKATTLTATCPCHLFFRGFKTAVCPASNPPNPSNPSASLSTATTLTATCPFQGNNSHSCIRSPGFKPSKRRSRPPRQQLVQLHAPAICFSRGSRSVRPASNPPNAAAGLSKATTLTATCPYHLFFRGFKTAVCPASSPPNPSNPSAGLSKATTLTATCPCHLFFRGFKTAVCPATNPPNPSAGLSTATTLAATCPFQGNNSHSYICPPGFKPSKRRSRPPRQQLLQLHAPAICFSRGSRLPFARLQTLQTLPQAFPRQQLLQLHAPAICFSGGSRLPFARLQTLQTLQTLPQAFPRQQLLQLHAPAICFWGGSRLPGCRHSKAIGCIWGTWLKSHPNYRYRWIIRCSKLRQSVSMCVVFFASWIKTPLGLYCVDDISPNIN